MNTTSRQIKVQVHGDKGAQMTIASANGDQRIVTMDNTEAAALIYKLCGALGLPLPGRTTLDH